MGIRLTGDWDKALDFSDRAKKAIASTLKAEAEGLAEKMRTGLATGAPAGTVLAPLHPLTAALKGSRISLAGMEKWVAVKQVGLFAWFVGIVDPEGIRIGVINEEGRTWSQVWTARQRRWFFATMARFGLLDPNRPPSGRPPGAPVEHRIPARPFVRPIQEAYLPGARKRVGDAVVRAILG